MEKLRILIADDHPIFRKGLRLLLDSMPTMAIAGEAATGREAVEMVTSLEPDVVLMDLQMPDGTGLAATRQITEEWPQIRILVVTLFEDEESVFTALRAGARGYLLKDAGEEEMVRAIQAVAKGEAIFSPAIAARLIDFFATAGSLGPEALFPELTAREREILALIAQGEANAAIAQKLAISQKTVHNYVSSIFHKLQVTDRAQAAILAREAGLGQDEFFGNS